MCGTSSAVIEIWGKTSITLVVFRAEVSCTVVLFFIALAGARLTSMSVGGSSMSSVVLGQVSRSSGEGDISFSPQGTFSRASVFCFFK
uniref:Secreted protein n=1 Tax=Engystomops pustulosus TaxID=76066 RepID=A0AAV6YTF9_ENGPU|nr:hypothetical protein GDO81_018838 [Engystomops pustulosus]